jgi:acyl-CoA hydrolase
VVGEMIANSGLKDLGIHTEMFVDSMVDMVEKGRIAGARKNIDKYKLPGRTNQKRAKTG